mgnify:CR=1 FL=1
MTPTASGRCRNLQQLQQHRRRNAVAWGGSIVPVSLVSSNYHRSVCWGVCKVRGQRGSPRGGGQAATPAALGVALLFVSMAKVLGCLGVGVQGLRPQQQQQLWGIPAACGSVNVLAFEGDWVSRLKAAAAAAAAAVAAGLAGFPAVCE